jgi:hypothetical protein
MNKAIVINLGRERLEKHHFHFFVLIVTLLTFASAQGLANNKEKIKPTFVRLKMEAIKIKIAPVIDGKLNEIPWEDSQGYKDFKTFEPDYGTPISETTIAYTAYDEENLYFAFDCRDSRPDQIKASMTKRDNIFNDDIVAVFLDSYNDLQGAYVFFVNPYGIQGDLMMDAQGSGDPLSADFIWESAGQITDQGYLI